MSLSLPLICDHVAAEPVVTLDGETVSVICPTCDISLPTKWIGCTHDDYIENTPFGSSARTFLCCYCGAEHSRPVLPRSWEDW